MCLTITVEVAGLGEDELGSLARELSTPDLFFAVQGPGFLRRHAPRLAVHGCGLLAEDADWDAPTWSMTDDGASRLSAALLRLFKLASQDVSVAALWDGDRAETRQAISQQDLVRIADASEFGTRTRYLIAR